MNKRSSPRRKAITLPELLVMLAIMAILIALLFPILLRARSRTRTDACSQRLGRIVLATQEFASLGGTYPIGVIDSQSPIQNVAEGMHHGWATQLLPFLSEYLGSANIDEQKSVYAEEHTEMRSQRLPALTCPASPPHADTTVGVSCYAGNHHSHEAAIDTSNNGVFFLQSQLGQDDIADGLSFTLFFGEMKNDANEANLGWMSGTRATLRNTGTVPNQTLHPTNNPLFVGGFGSWHVDGCHLAMGDSKVSFMSNLVDPIVYQQLGSRMDGSQFGAESNAE